MKNILLSLVYLIFLSQILFGQQTDKIASLQQQLVNAKTDSAKIELYIAIGNEYIKNDQPNQAIDYYKKALKLSEENTYFIKN
jgi:hypothetical protein